MFKGFAITCGLEQSAKIESQSSAARFLYENSDVNGEAVVGLGTKATQQYPMAFPAINDMHAIVQLRLCTFTVQLQKQYVVLAGEFTGSGDVLSAAPLEDREQSLHCFKAFHMPFQHTGWLQHQLHEHCKDMDRHQDLGGKGPDVFSCSINDPGCEEPLRQSWGAFWLDYLCHEFVEFFVVLS